MQNIDNVVSGVKGNGNVTVVSPSQLIALLKQAYKKGDLNLKQK